MAIKVKPLAEVVDKWVDVTPGRSAYYEAGAVGAGADWQKGSKAAAAAYKAGVSAGNIQQLFTGGIDRAGAEKYDRKVKDVGVGRFGSGVAAAKTDYEKGISPMLEEIARVDLQARQPRGSDANWERSKKVGVALHKKRLALRAAGG